LNCLNAFGIISLFYNIISEPRLRKRQQPRPEIGHCIDLFRVRRRKCFV